MTHQYGAQRFRYSKPQVPMCEISYRKRGRKVSVVPGSLTYVPQPNSYRIGPYAVREEIMDVINESTERSGSVFVNGSWWVYEIQGGT